MSGKRDDNAINLDEARALTPAPNPVEAMRRQCAVAAFGAVKEADVTAMVEKLREMAMNGDLKAMKMYMELCGAMGRNAVSVTPPANDVGIRMLADSISDLVDEVRVERARNSKQAKVLNGEEQA